jgi:putative SOS response-associated peptidase YedK
MCGRFVLAISGEAIAASMEAAPLLPAFVEALAAWRPRWNIAPSSILPVVRAAPSGARDLLVMRWGLVPAWASDPAIGQRMTNARCESIAEKPAFREAWRHRRCLIPATAFYEWQTQPDGGRKRPYAFAAPDGATLAFAGVWERWHRREHARSTGPIARSAPPAEPSLFDALGDVLGDALGDALGGTIDPSPSDAARDGDEDILSLAIITTEANACMRPVHDRMPVLIAPADRDRWLHATEPPSDLLAPAPAEWLRSWPVSMRVSNARTDDPTCLEPLV